MRPAGIIALPLVFLLFACAEKQPTPGPAEEPSPWSSRNLGTDAEFRDLFFLDDQRGWIVGGSHKIRGGIVGQTEDGGLTWSFASGLARPSPRSLLFHLNAIQFLDERTGVIAADGGRILRTIDGGANWHRVHGPGGISAHLRDLHFPDPQNGWAAGGQLLLRTTDGGASWYRPIALDDESGFNARAIHFADGLVGWAAARHGTVFHTTDGGEHWTVVHEPGRRDIVNSLYFVDRRHGWVVGERGTIRHTSDGGFSWRRQSERSRTRLTDVWFIDPRRGWAVGFDRRQGVSIVLQTDDGGENWTEQTTVHGEDLRALFFSSTGRGWSVGVRVRPMAQKLWGYEPEG